MMIQMSIIEELEAIRKEHPDLFEALAKDDITLIQDDK